MAIQWTKQELEFIENHKDLIESKNYASMFSLSYRDLMDIDYIGLKLCILVSMLSGDKIGVSCIPERGPEWALIFQFADKSFDSIGSLTNVPKNPSARKEWVEDYVEEFLSHVFGMDEGLIKQIMELTEVV